MFVYGKLLKLNEGKQAAFFFYMCAPFKKPKEAATP